MGMFKVIGDRDFLSVVAPSNDDISDAARAVRSVALIRSGIASTATGFMVSGNLLMTNNHVLPNMQAAMAATATFGLVRDNDGQKLEGETFKFNPEREFVTDFDLDYTVCFLDRPPADGKAHVDLSEVVKVTAGDNAVLLGHPDGRHMEVVTNDNEILRVDKENSTFRYRADSEDSSSGSPVFNANWKPIGLHHYSAVQSDGSDGNEGIELRSILRDWKEKSQSLG